ncbi:hypothetical protein F9K91_24045 [Brucella tritici]|uniref:Yop protein translocation protein D periplasmic domain-containing protein n=1 Tax=Brucella tritici TaxID=94626 RepID=A0A6L3Y8W3_9HYPH|nr:FHA domain-containing protein [Brucella tritici]KAB2661843.1 hypothetical protein F9K91_24045 [Brucella tritici]KAB2676338.1 hypothetical protein F9L08_26700 [Brucella tritici]
MHALPVILEKWRNGFADGNVRLSVAAGLHRGATISLDGSAHVIGSDAEADIVLKDAGIAPRHVLLRPAGRRIEIEAVGGHVEVDSHHVSEGHGYRTRLPVNIVVGSARMVICAPSQPEPKSFFRRPTTAVAAVVCCVGVFVSLAAHALMSAPVGARLDTDTANTVQVATQNTAETPTMARGILTAQLDQAGISGVTLAVEKNRLVASGALAKEKSEAWLDIQSWFDRTYGDKIVLTSNVTVSGVGAPPRLALQAIWFGPNSYVLAGDGARYHEGAYVDDGWMISKIGEKSLHLSKEGATIALNYR